LTEELREMSSNNYAYQLSKYNSYNIDDLITAWESGWKHLERYAKLQSSYEPKRSGDKSKTISERIRLTLDELTDRFLTVGRRMKVPKSGPFVGAILNLAASSKEQPFKCKIGNTVLTRNWHLDSPGAWVKDRVQSAKILRKVTKAFATSNSYGQALSKLASKDNIKRFFGYVNDAYSAYSDYSQEEYQSHQIEPLLQEAMRWLESGLKSKAACNKAWWNCLWLSMKSTVDLMLDIKRGIDEDIPICFDKIDRLNYYIAFGCPEITLREQDNGAFKSEIILRPKESELDRLNLSPLTSMSVILLLQPAFELSQRFQQSLTEPRFVQQCHAPSCRKFFYTQRNLQVVCGGSVGNKKTGCALEWVRYKRFLQKIGKNPEKHWDNQQLKKQFIAYDQS